MASLYVWISVYRALKSIHVSMNKKTSRVFNGVMLKHNVPKQVSSSGKYTWYRYSAAHPHFGEVLDELRATSKKPGLIGLKRAAFRPNGHDTSALPGMESELKSPDTDPRQIPTPLPPAPEDGVLVTVQYGLNKAIHLTMGDAQEIHRRLSTLFGARK